ncbi:MAG TPA: GFA family protein [Rhizomicrobium sp.]|jgi:hypothetical protein|nr:GFA family protein [Rhizomicrobium sp.]
MTKHKGGCHCGRIAFEIEGDITEAVECNCSLCAKRGGLLHFVLASAFALTSPRRNLSTYKFNQHAIDHHFCARCGISPFSEGIHPQNGKMAAINLRCVDGIDPKSLTIKFHDGLSD